jgi:hypothetical protein
MTFLKNLWADLVDKRLWPVLVVFAVALVAIPLVLLKSGGNSSSSAPPIPSAAVPSANRSVVSVDGQATPRVKLTGSSRDPFRGRGNQSGTPSSAPASAASPATASSGSPTPSTSGTGSTGAGTGSTGSTGNTGGGGGPTPVPSRGSSGGGSSSHGSVFVRFGKSGGSQSKRVVHPLEALPSRKNPMVVFLGEKSGRAVFLVSSDVVTSGKMQCKPSKDICQKAYVKPHTKIKVTVDYPHTHYVIEVLRAGS